ncbi:hypothetical protein ACIBF6_19055 [Streptosporangium amethystogenes]|uniref:hypothetical protein n=1 Tax=Streptosporangium amethystogenes TaxID=2002 RepID=UPI00379185C3
MKNAIPRAWTRLALPSAGPAALALLTAVALTSGCGGTPAPASSPQAAATSSAPSTGAPGPAASSPAATPELFGTEFQAAPEHDWSKGGPPPFEGVLRGWLTDVDEGGVAEYRPIRFTQSGGEDGHFDGPEEGDVTRYAAPIAEDVLFLADSGCDGSSQTYDKATNLGTERCTRQTLIDNVKEAASLAGVEGLYRPALITTENGRITKVVEIFWQGGG